MEATVCRFLLFLGSVLGFAITSYAVFVSFELLIRKHEAIRNSYVVVAAIIFDVVMALFLFLFTWTLTGHTFASRDWGRYVLLATLVVLVGVKWAIFLPLRLYVIVSRNISEDIRSRLFISQLGQSMSVLLLVSVFIWTVDGTGTTAEVLGEYFVFSPIVAYVVVVYLVAVLIGEAGDQECLREAGRGKGRMGVEPLRTMRRSIPTLALPLPGGGNNLVLNSLLILHMK